MAEREAERQPAMESVADWLASRAGEYGGPVRRQVVESIRQLGDVDRATYEAIATTPTPALDEPLRRLSRTADKSKLWLAIAAGLAIGGGTAGRRAALRGTLAIGATSALVNLGIKPVSFRTRPDRDHAGVPDERHVKMPGSTSFPSGHSASAFAFATAISRDRPWAALACGFLAAAVAYSRVHTGVHYPGGGFMTTLRPRLKAVLASGAACALAITCLSACSRGPGERPVVSSIGGQAATGTAPPPLTVLTQHTGGGHGDIFIAPAGGGYPAGPEILSSSGRVVWFHRLPAGDVATDFRTQTYLGQPVLTWFQSGGQGAHGGPGGPAGAAGPVSPDGPSGTDYIYNDRYQPIATVRAGHGDATNFHEFLITPWNTALILANIVTSANLTSIGGPADQQVIDGLVQEIDIKTGRVLFEWDSADHVPYSDSYQPRPPSPSTPWDWFHINAVHLDSDGNLLVDSRNTWTTYKVNRQTGRIMWQLGGKRSSFTLRAAPGQVLDHAGKIFAWQHDPEAIGGGEYTFFDDESGGNLLSSSRVVTVRLDLATRVATLVKSDNQPEGQVAQVMGNAQTTPRGDLFVGWGGLPYISEFSPAGKPLFNAKLPAGVSTYRAYLLPWHPAT